MKVKNTGLVLAAALILTLGMNSVFAGDMKNGNSMVTCKAADGTVMKDKISADECKKKGGTVVEEKK